MPHSALLTNSYLPSFGLLSVPCTLCIDSLATFDNQDILLEKFAQKQPSCVAYDEKMQVYKTVGSEVAAFPNTKEVEFALLRMDPLASALQENARCWVTSLGKLLNDAAKDSLIQLQAELTVSGNPC